MMLALEVQYNGKLKQNEVESFLLKLTTHFWHCLGGSKLALFGWIKVGIVWVGPSWLCFAPEILLAQNRVVSFWLFNG